MRRITHLIFRKRQEKRRASRDLNNVGLRRCPFCGSDQVVDIVSDIDKWVQVHCYKCDAFGPKSYIYSSEKSYTSEEYRRIRDRAKERAYKEWNSALRRQDLEHLEKEADWLADRVASLNAQPQLEAHVRNYAAQFWRDVADISIDLQNKTRKRD